MEPTNSAPTSTPLDLDDQELDLASGGKFDFGDIDFRTIRNVASLVGGIFGGGGDDYYDSGYGYSRGARYYRQDDDFDVGNILGNLFGGGGFFF